MKSTKLTINKTKAISIYNTADASGKQILEAIFGKRILDVNKKQTKPSFNIMDKIKTVADVCKIQGITKKDYPYPSLVGKQVRKNTLRAMKRKIYINQLFLIDNIVEALNEMTALSFENNIQEKWRPWYNYNTSMGRFVFAYSDYYYASTSAGCGPRLCFKSKELCDYFGEKFCDEMDKLLKITF